MLSASKLKVVIILVKDSDCSLVKLFRSKGIKALSIKFKIGEGYTDHLLKVDMPIDLRSLKSPDVSLMRVSTNYLWATSPSCTSCKILSKFSCIPDPLQYISCEGVYIRAIVKGSLDACRLLKDMKRSGLNAELVLMQDFDEEPSLTPKQRQILNTAVELGYFEDPKKIVLEDLAEMAKISKSALNRSLRRSVNKVVKWFINNYVKYRP